MAYPIAYRWDGERMEPLPRFNARCAKDYVIGEVYALVSHEERSSATHRHEFAWLREAWKNLPEDVAEQYPTTEHLRKSALIDCGYFDETSVDCGSQAAALRVAAFMRATDDLARIVTRGSYVVKRTAKSQSRRAMNRKEFQESKTAIMDRIAAMVGVSSETLQANAERAA